MATKLFCYYVFWSFRLLLSPLRYFQLNAKYFNENKGIYSKLDIDKYIPKQWLLKQKYLDEGNIPEIFPVFIKPEWGQNGNKVFFIDSKEKFCSICNKIKNDKITYIVQEFAAGSKEFELFYIQDPDNKKEYITLTITQTINNVEKNPVNSIHNNNTKYKDITGNFTKEQMATIKDNLSLLPRFKIARVGVKSNTKEDLVSGNFSIIEINLFTPMPINLLDIDYSKTMQKEFIKENMYYLVKLSASISKSDFKKFILFKKIVYHYKVKSAMAIF